MIRGLPQLRKAWFRRACALGVFVAAVGLCALPVLAGDDPPVRGGIAIEIDTSTMPRTAASVELPGRRSGTGRLYHDHFLPRVRNRLEWQTQIHLTLLPGQLLDDHVMFNRVSRGARRSLEKAAQGALEEFVLTETTLGLLLDRLDRKAPSTSSRVGRRELDFGLGISRGLPELKMTYETGRGEVEFSLSPLGALEMNYGPGGHSRSRFWAAFDVADDAYHVGCRLAF